MIARSAAIVLDEISSFHIANFEAFINLLKEVNFKGALLVVGDFRQIAPVVTASVSKHDTLAASPKTSHFWKDVVCIALSKLHRQINDPDFANSISKIGDGDWPASDEAKTKLKELGCDLLGRQVDITTLMSKVGGCMSCRN